MDSQKLVVLHTKVRVLCLGSNKAFVDTKSFFIGQYKCLQPCQAVQEFNSHSTSVSFKVEELCPYPCIGVISFVVFHDYNSVPLLCCQVYPRNIGP